MEELEQFVKKILHQNETNVRFSHGIVHPQRDWILLLLLFVGVVVTLVLISSWLFLSLSSDNSSFITGDVPVQTLDREEIQEALSLFQVRESALEALRSSKPVIGNP